MTQLTDKMEGLRANYVDHICRFNDAPQTCECYGLAVDASIALVKAEEAVVGDWEAEFEGFIEALFDKHGESYEVYNPVAFTADIGKFITTLLAAKDREAAEAAATEYRQFILNVLDGIDIADGECTTKAIRLAIASRIIKSTSL
jgi:hypothetical protein